MNQMLEHATIGLIISDFDKTGIYGRTNLNGQIWKSNSEVNLSVVYYPKKSLWQNLASSQKPFYEEVDKET